MSLREAEWALQSLPERYRVERSRISRYERDEPGTTIDPHSLKALAAAYNRDLDDLDPEAAAELAVLASVIAGGDDTIVTYRAAVSTMRGNSGAPHRAKRAAA